MSRDDELKERYAKAMHGVQSGVAMKMNFDATDTTPKHLRTGINSAMVDTAALTQLLIRKGIFTQEEHLEELVVQAERERAAYEAELSALIGTDIRLG